MVYEASSFHSIWSEAIELDQRFEAVADVPPLSRVMI